MHVYPAAVRHCSPLTGVYFPRQLCPKIKARMMEHGTLMVCYQPLRTTSTQRPNFFRNIINNQAVTRDDIRFMLDEIERLGSDL